MAYGRDRFEQGDLLGSEIAVRACIEACICPVCGKGPYRLLSGHTNHAHSITAAELREMAVLPKHAPTCSPEVSEARREWCLRTGKEVHPTLEQMRTKRSLSMAAVRANRENTKRVTWAQRFGGLQVARQRQAERLRPLYEQAEILWREGWLLKEIGKAVGLHPATLARYLKTQGLMGDGRGPVGGNRWASTEHWG